MKTVMDYFLELPDYRKNKVQHTPPGLVLFVSLLAMLAGAQGYSDMSLWIRQQKLSLSRLLGKPFKSPSTGTIWKVFNYMSTDDLSDMLARWSREHTDIKDKEQLVVSADGKHIRDDGDKRTHMLSLFLNDKKIILAHTVTDDKSNEIPAMVELLETLNLKNCVVTMDAMHTQKNIEKDSTTAA